MKPMLAAHPRGDRGLLSKLKLFPLAFGFARG